MSIEIALILTDTAIFAHTGKHLNDLQNAILQEVWQGKKYVEIAEKYHCTEGHIKDVAYLLWKHLTEALRERVTKSNFKTVIKRQVARESLNFPMRESETINFIGRSNAINYLNSLVNQGNQVILIQGEGGIGKTTLAREYLKTKDFEFVLELLMAKETANIVSVDSILEEWLSKDFLEEPGKEFGVTLERFKRQLKNYKIGILIDNLEPALDKHGNFITLHRNYVELLRVLADASVQSITLITSRDRLCESDVTVAHFRLPGLDENAWYQFFSFQSVQVEINILRQMHKIYGGNAKAMGILSGVIAEDFAGDMQSYWQEYQANPLGKIDLKNLVASQFNRLQKLDADAYQLLCRLGCYRYQDVPNIVKAGLLALLWDVRAGKEQQIIESLRNRSLVEFASGQYWLHPVIRAEAVSRLKESQQWLIINDKVAHFFTNSVKKVITIADALMALEAYYHYVEIEDFEQASQVILKTRDNQWGQFLPLGSTLYRLGLLQPILTAITLIIDKIKPQFQQGELYNILGDLYWITGKIKQAITCQEHTLNIVRQSLPSLSATNENQHTLYYLKMLEIDSLLSLGLYNLDLWNLQEAANLFQQVIEFTHNTAHYRWGQKASVCLALCNSYLGYQQAAIFLADAIYQKVLTNKLLGNTGRFAYFLQILGQAYANLGHFSQSSELYQRAIAFADESNYKQVKGKALTGLAEIARQQEDFQLACTHHLEAIQLLEAISAKCDLAEAYFQLGLTYQRWGKIEQSQPHFAEAIRLFLQMEAPGQVEKVLKFCVT